MNVKELVQEVLERLLLIVVVVLWCIVGAAWVYFRVVPQAERELKLEKEDKWSDARESEMSLMWEAAKDLRAKEALYRIWTGKPFLPHIAEPPDFRHWWQNAHAEDLRRLRRNIIYAKTLYVPASLACGLIGLVLSLWTLRLRLPRWLGPFLLLLVLLLLSFWCWKTYPPKPVRPVGAFLAIVSTTFGVGMFVGLLVWGILVPFLAKKLRERKVIPEEHLLRWGWPLEWRAVRPVTQVGSIRRFWTHEYPLQERRQKLRIGKRLTWLENFWMTILVGRHYLSPGYVLRGYFVNDAWSHQCVEFYVFSRDVLLVLMLCFHDVLRHESIVAVFVVWMTLGAVLHPLRLVFVDRYGQTESGGPWVPLSFNRSLLFLFVNYAELIVGFAYLYLHFEAVGYLGSMKPISSAWDALYFSVVTITTLGYGDLRPITTHGEALALIQPLSGIFLMVLVLGYFFVELGQPKIDD